MNSLVLVVIYVAVFAGSFVGIAAQSTSGSITPSGGGVASGSGDGDPSGIVVEPGNGVDDPSDSEGDVGDCDRCLSYWRFVYFVGLYPCQVEQTSDQSTRYDCDIFVWVSAQLAAYLWQHTRCARVFTFPRASNVSCNDCLALVPVQ